MEAISYIVVAGAMVGIPLYLLYAWIRAAKEAEKPSPLEELSL